MNKLSNKLKELREERGITQKELSEMLNITSSAYGYYEQDRAQPSLEIILQLSDFYNVSIDYLLNKSNHKYGVETILNKFHNIKHNDLDIEKLKNLLNKIIFCINSNEDLNLSDEDMDKLLNELIDYIEYKIYRLKL